MGLLSLRQWMSTRTEIENERPQCTLGFWSATLIQVQQDRGLRGTSGDRTNRRTEKGHVLFRCMHFPAGQSRESHGRLHAGPFTFSRPPLPQDGPLSMSSPVDSSPETQLSGMRILWWAAMRKGRAAPAFGAINGPPPHPGIPVGVSASPSEHRIVDGMPSSAVVCDKEGDPQDTRRSPESILQPPGVGSVVYSR